MPKQMNETHVGSSRSRSCDRLLDWLRTERLNHQYQHQSHARQPMRHYAKFDIRDRSMFEQGPRWLSHQCEHPLGLSFQWSKRWCSCLCDHAPLPSHTLSNPRVTLQSEVHALEKDQDHVYKFLQILRGYKQYRRLNHPSWKMDGWSQDNQSCQFQPWSAVEQHWLLLMNEQYQTWLNQDRFWSSLLWTFDDLLLCRWLLVKHQWAHNRISWEHHVCANLRHSSKQFGHPWSAKSRLVFLSQWCAQPLPKWLAQCKSHQPFLGQSWWSQDCCSPK